MITLDERKELVLNIAKESGIGDQKSQVVLALDFSGSMRSMFRDGSVDKLLQRVLPIAMAFDDNEEIDAFLFNDGVTHVGGVTKSNLSTRASEWVENHHMGGTKYAPFIREIVSSYQNKGLFGGRKPMKLPAFVIVPTDGDNSDHAETKRAIRDASEVGIFFQFIGMGREHFSFLERLDTLDGRRIDNAGFFKSSDINTMKDTQLYNMILNEYPSWIKGARTINLIV